MLLRIEGEPIPKSDKIGKGGRMYDARKSEKSLIKWELRKQYHGPLLRRYLRVSWDFYLTIPQKTPLGKRLKMLSGELRPDKAPDLDNLIKLIQDCLTKTVIYDDRYIVSYGHTDKWWAEKGYTLINIQDISSKTASSRIIQPELEYWQNKTRGTNG
jgi:Holliday junction resolvase RusA-like endonuclease